MGGREETESANRLKRTASISVTMCSASAIRAVLRNSMLPVNSTRRIVKDKSSAMTSALRASVSGAS